jgi:hypothetical protein
VNLARAFARSLEPRRTCSRQQTGTTAAAAPTEGLLCRRTTHPAAVEASLHRCRTRAQTPRHRGVASSSCLTRRCSTLSPAGRSPHVVAVEVGRCCRLPARHEGGDAHCLSQPATRKRAHEWGGRRVAPTTEIDTAETSTAPVAAEPLAIDPS